MYEPEPSLVFRCCLGRFSPASSVSRASTDSSAMLDEFKIRETETPFQFSWIYSGCAIGESSRSNHVLVIVLLYKYVAHHNAALPAPPPATHAPHKHFHPRFCPHRTTSPFAAPPRLVLSSCRFCLCRLPKGERRGVSTTEQEIPPSVSICVLFPANPPA